MAARPFRRSFRKRVNRRPLNNIPIFTGRGTILAGDIDFNRIAGRQRSALKASDLPTLVTAHTLGTEALELVRGCSIPGLFVAVERVAWLLCGVTYRPWRGGVGGIGRGPRRAIVPRTSVVEFGGAVA